MDEPTLVERLLAQLERDQRTWAALSPGLRQSFESELAAIWPGHPPFARPAIGGN
jgi:hypothetical protein